MRAEDFKLSLSENELSTYPSFITEWFDNHGKMIAPTDLRSRMFNHYSSAQEIEVFHHPLCVTLAGFYRIGGPVLLDDISNFSVGLSATDIAVPLAAKLTYAIQDLRKERFDGFLMMVERPYRIEALTWLISHGKLSKDEIRGRVMSVWRDTEFPSSDRDTWLALFRAAKREHNAPLCDEDGCLEKLPDVITVFRGTRHPDDEIDEGMGLSWTLDEMRARWFSRRFATDDDEHGVLSAEVARDDILACLMGRGESEIVIDPDILEKISVSMSP